MFKWFWNFLYSISKGLMSLIDGIMSCANKLSGIESIRVDGKETDFLTFLFESDQIKFAFRVSAIAAIVIITFFSIFAIIRSVVKEGSQESPIRVVGKTFKIILEFLFVPVCMIVFSQLLNTLMAALYKATLNGASTIGKYLFTAFAEDAWKPGFNAQKIIADEGFNYKSTDAVRNVIELDDFNFIYSWIACFPILFCLAKSMLTFIERAISICLLYIAAPFSISTAIVDDGQRFKLWRDQILVKFINGYGMILGINIYCLVVGLVSSSSVQFFDDGFLNALIKIVIMLGGAFALQQVQSVLGNLVQAGAGSNETREAMAAAAATGHMLGSIASSPFRAGRSLYNFGRDTANFGLGTTVAQRLGLRNKNDYLRYNMEKNLANKKNADGVGGSGEGSDSQNTNKPNYNNENSINNALTGNNQNSNNNPNNNNQNNTNNNNNQGTGNSMINNALGGFDDDEDLK